MKLPFSISYQTKLSVERTPPPPPPHTHTPPCLESCLINWLCHTDGQGGKKPWWK